MRRSILSCTRSKQWRLASARSGFLCRYVSDTNSATPRNRAVRRTKELVNEFDPMVAQSIQEPRPMFDTVILLSGDAELSVLPHVLIGHNPYLKVIKAKTAFDLLALNS